MKSKMWKPHFTAAFQDKWLRLPDVLRADFDADVLLVLNDNCPSRLVCEETGIREAVGTWFIITYAEDHDSGYLHFLDCMPTRPEDPRPPAREAMAHSVARVAMRRLLDHAWAGLSRRKLFVSSEYVSAGHPDKIADRISDQIVDSCYRHALLEGMTNQVVITGETRGPASITRDLVAHTARMAIRDIGYCQPGFLWEKVDINVYLHAQSTDIAPGVDTDGAGDQRIMFGSACRDTPELMPAPIFYAHLILRAIDAARHRGAEPKLRPNSKRQLTVVAVTDAQQHLDENMSSVDIRDLIEPYVHNAFPGGWITMPTHWHVNPTGKFVIGGPDGDAGLTGRKIILDAYGGAALAERARIAETYIEPARLGYFRLKPAPETASPSDRIGDANLVDDPARETQDLLKDLLRESEYYTNATPSLFKFYQRPDRDIWGLLANPQSYADLEEENIEERFPGDIRTRALVCALNTVIKRNQRTHIAKKRTLQKDPTKVDRLGAYAVHCMIKNYLCDEMAPVHSSFIWDSGKLSSELGFGSADPNTIISCIIKMLTLMPKTKAYMLRGVVYLLRELLLHSQDHDMLNDVRRLTIGNAVSAPDNVCRPESLIPGYNQTNEISFSILSLPLTDVELTAWKRRHVAGDISRIGLHSIKKRAIKSRFDSTASNLVHNQWSNHLGFLRSMSADQSQSCGSLADMVGFAPLECATSNAASYRVVRSPVTRSSTRPPPPRFWRIGPVRSLQWRPKLPPVFEEKLRPTNAAVAMIAMRDRSFAQQPV